AMDDDLSGQRLGRFRVVEPLGKGGHGIVYRAIDKALERPVAIKVLRANVISDEARRQRFLREARAAAALSHPSVAAVHEVGEAEGRVYIVMELVPGESLRRRLARGALSIDDALRVARAIAAGLAEA